MNWAILIKDSETIEEDVNAIIREKATHGLEIVGAVSVDHGVLVLFRMMRREAPAHVTARIVDRDGYPR